MRKFYISALVSSLMLFGGYSNQNSKAAESGYQNLTPSEIIAGINAYRTSVGLQALSTNNILMSTAQSQSDYQASINSVTHTGPGGTRPKDRASAAGYGNGGNIFLSEIIYGGFRSTPQTAITWWKGSTVHNNAMLSATYKEIGAGVATDGDRSYFTAHLGYAPNGSSSTNTGDSVSVITPVVFAIPVVVATSMNDGSVIHIVRSGQALWTISVVYKVDLQIIFDLNFLTETSLIFPGDEIIVHPAKTPVVQITDIPTDTPEPSSPTPTKTSTKVVAAELNSGENIGEESEFSSGIIKETEIPTENSAANPTIRSIITLTFIVLILILFGSVFLQKMPSRPPKDDLVK